MWQLGDRDCYYYVVSFCCVGVLCKYFWLHFYVINSISHIDNTASCLATGSFVKYSSISSMHSMSDYLFPNTTFIVRILKFQRVVALRGIFFPQFCSVPLRVEENY
ncbi:unnamed protein product [Acanthoscelides obtectus]|uniref:Uncharacterized protein n=1 Tax=Acanthoscelides obtectus TaxID=200917 RepID=A0A9P0L460_ACAOB|nr:unnamed protein product [Acanthoscelides obtectus]CAH2016250.1 unnamed protein product [Acanthoscelides obtectus]CAK1630442.1 hypothetical protein AOBTE_LOCUS6331 [Acanthoscelides obtectus]CAK1630528.1 hypothetical protein AOBTE_LOCUS6385 [Acanthoscelides obtectus]